MDQSFVSNDFENFPNEIKTNYIPRQPERKLIAPLSVSYYCCGSADKTQKRAQELKSLDGGGVLDLRLHASTPAELEKQLNDLRSAAADIVSGRTGVQLSDNYKNEKCKLKFACESCWGGQHEFSHTTSHQIISHLLMPLYDVRRRDTQKPKAVNQADMSSVWDVEISQTSNAPASYRYTPHPKQDYAVEAYPRVKNVDMGKTHLLFRQTIVEFFAGKREMPRIGALKVERHASDKLQEEWCKAPYCLRTIMAQTPKDKNGRPVCNKYHSDESSFLTSLLRILVECRKIPIKPEAFSYTPKRDKYESRERYEPRAPRKVYEKISRNTIPVETQNAFATLLDSEN